MNLPRILPLIGIAVAGVLAVKVLSGVGALPDMVAAGKAFAEGKVAAKTADAGKAGAPGASSSPADPGAPVLPPGLTPTGAPLPGSPAALAAAAAAAAAAQSAPTALACGPDAKDLAKEAGLSPAELQILQSLGARRGQLDQREQDMDVQIQLLAAAEGKLDAKLKALAAMKVDIQGLLTQADGKKSAEIDRLVIVYSKMKPKDAAVRMAVLDDSVRLPIAAKMKESALSQILGLMNTADAKSITEKLAQRFDNKILADARSAVSPTAPAAPAPAPVKTAAATPPASAAPGAPGANPLVIPPGADAAKPVKVAKARPKRRRAKATALAANTAAPDLAGDAKAAGATQPPPRPSATPNAAGASPPVGKSG